MRRRLALFALILATIASPVVFQSGGSVAVAGEGELCFGQVPTIVGAPGEELLGTEGADVVVTNGAAGADTAGGNDLVCISGLVGGQYLTGSGNDRIDTTRAEVDTVTLLIDPGSGMDEVLGGASGTTWVTSNDADADVINTGSASDNVYAGGQDTVTLGPGNDFLSVDLDGEAVGGKFEGGTGADELTLRMRLPNEEPAWTVDTVSQRISRDEKVIASVQGFSAFRTIARGQLTFLGSNIAERFSSFGVSQNRVPKWPIRVYMNGGNDTVNFNGGAPSGLLDGGEGADWFNYRNSHTYGYPHKLTFNLASGVLRDTWGTGDAITRRAVNFENARSELIGPVTIKGTSGPNILESKWGWKTSDSSIFEGRAGDDVLIGVEGYDELIGGPGMDVTRGGAGIDRCVAETRIHCEE